MRGWGRKVCSEKGLDKLSCGVCVRVERGEGGIISVIVRGGDDGGGGRGRGKKLCSRKGLDIVVERVCA